MDQDAEFLTERDDVVVQEVVARAEAAGAVELLSGAQRRIGAPLVDEAEQHRLERFVEGGAPLEGWRGVLARRGTTTVGYGALVVPPPGSGTVNGDAAVLVDDEPTEPVLRALLSGLNRLAGEVPRADRLVVWVRHVGEDERAFAEAEGFVVMRRLGILGRTLADGAGPAPSSGDDAGDVAIRGYRGEVDDPAVVEVLADAYAGTEEAGWDLERFRERRELPWFRSEDLLVAEGVTGRIDGVAWLKRRGGDVGELYNLAVHSRAQGEGLGERLLVAALTHLGTSCRQVLLWVDLANERAVRLYRSQGFETVWEDVALLRPAGADVAPRK